MKRDKNFNLVQNTTVMKELNSNNSSDIIKKIDDLESNMDLLYEKKNSSQKGLCDGWTRATFILQEELLEKIKKLAYWERKTVKDVVNSAFIDFFNRQ